MEPLNQVRGYHFLLGIFRSQQKDPYCSICSAYANTLAAVRESLAKFEADHSDSCQALTQELGQMFAETRDGLSALQGPTNPTGQKKAGNCKLPKGVCFIKAPFSIIQQI